MTTSNPSNSVLIRSVIFIFDSLALLLIFNLAFLFRFGEAHSKFCLTGEFLLVLMIVQFCAYLFGLHGLSIQSRVARSSNHFVSSVLLATAIIAVAIYVFRIDSVEFFGRGVFIGAIIMFIAYGYAVRPPFLRLFNWYSIEERWLIVGEAKFLNPFLDDASIDFRSRFHFVAEGLMDIGAPDKRYSALSWDQIDDYLSEEWTGIVIVSNSLPELVFESILKKRLSGTRVFSAIDFYESYWEKVPLYLVDQSWFTLSQGFDLLHSRVSLRLKRALDVVAVVMLTPIAVPIVLGAIPFVLSDGQGNVLYRQTRVGLDGHLFEILKLRTMRIDAEAEGVKWASENDTRATVAGRFLRKTRIDELPQLYNVLRGDMSFIGPRPERPEICEKLVAQIPHYYHRNLVRPGISGWAQVCYPYGASVADAKEKLQYDLFYIKNYSFLLDISVILRTIRVVLNGAGR